MPRPKHGICCCCQRDAALTFHHLIPRKLHRRTHFKKSFSKQQLNQGIMVCRTCHSGIHKRYDEMYLAKNLDTEARIKNDQALANFFEWVSKQKIQF